MACPVSRVPGQPRILPHGKGPVPRRDSAVVTVCLAKIGFYPLRSLADVETVSSCPTPQAGSRTRLPRCSHETVAVLARGLGNDQPGVVQSRRLRRLPLAVWDQEADDSGSPHPCFLSPVAFPGWHRGTVLLPACKLRSRLSGSQQNMAREILILLLFVFFGQF